jgi:gluconate 5-dehydrogenase
MKSIYSLDQKIILITGANGQLGGATIKLIKSLGAIVIGCDVQSGAINSNSLDEYYQLDIRNEKDIKKVFDNVFKKYGKLDCLINNAGVSTFENFEERPEESFDWVMDVNLKGTFLCIKNYVNSFDENAQKSGRILNIGSFYGVISPDPRIYIDLPRKNSEVYGATKAGVIQMTKYFAVHLAKRNILVNCISPGGILNPESPQGEAFQKEYAYRCPLGRMANQEEIVAAVPFLLSDSSSYVNGINLVIDGAMSCW